MTRRPDGRIRLCMGKDVFAFEFGCPMTLEQVRLAFEATGIGEWILRDSHWWDDYLNSRPSPKVRMRVFEPMEGRGPPYVLQCNVEEGCELSREEIVELVRRLLAAVGVDELTSVESWD